VALELFRKKVLSKDLKVGVIGLGYVGLPLAMAFAKNGYSVTGIDLDERKVAALNRGRSYILDVPSADVAAMTARRRFRATGDYKALSGADAIIICVPTPLSKTKEPDISFVIDATRRISQILRRGQLVVLESTTYPGTTEEVMLPILERSKGLRVERDFFLAFSPERVDPGNKVYDTVSIPKVVGGAGRRSTTAVKLLYGSVIRTIVPVSSARAAEMVKLLENTFRSVNIGLINEIALLSHRLGINIWEVIEAAKTKPFGFMAFYPGPGLGGHCLPIDPLYLSWKSRLHGYEARMIELAASINEAMPAHVVERVTHLLNERKIPMKGASVLVLGVAYKRDIDDPRQSPAIEVIAHLRRAGADVCYADPHLKTLDVDAARFTARRPVPALLKKQDCAVIVTDHTAFDYASIVKYSKLVLDTRNVLRRYRGRPNVRFL